MLSNYDRMKITVQAVSLIFVLFAAEAQAGPFRNRCKNGQCAIQAAAPAVCLPAEFSKGACAPAIPAVPKACAPAACAPACSLATVHTRQVWFPRVRAWLGL
jgi:hypothetical protein